MKSTFEFRGCSNIDDALSMIDTIVGELFPSKGDGEYFAVTLEEENDDEVVLKSFIISKKYIDLIDIIKDYETSGDIISQIFVFDSMHLYAIKYKFDDEGYRSIHSQINYRSKKEKEFMAILALNSKSIVNII